MSESFREEAERMDKFWELLRAEFSVEFHHEWGCQNSVYVKGELIMNVEVTNEVRTGGAAVHVQNAAYAAKYAALQGVHGGLQGTQVQNFYAFTGCHIIF